MTLQNRAELRSTLFQSTGIATEIAVELVELEPRKNAYLEPEGQHLVVIDGVAWVTMNGEDHVVKAGESCTFLPNADGFPICVSALGGKPVTYVIR